MNDQSRRESLYEAMINTAIGFVISYSAWPLVAFVAGFPYSHTTNFLITCFFTVLSITRGYVVRRWFNGKIKRAARRLAS